MTTDNIAAMPTPMHGLAAEISKVLLRESRDGDHRKLDRRSSFYGWPRGAEIAAVFQSTDTPYRIGRFVRAEPEIWELMLAALDGGVLLPNRRVPAFDHASLRLLFADAPMAIANRFNLLNEPDRALVRDSLLPAMIADRRALLKDPSRLARIVNHCQREHLATQRQARHEESVRHALAAMPIGQVEVIMYGERLWPRTHDRYGSYSFEQLTAAVWTFREFDTALCVGHREARSRAILIRHATKFLNEYCYRIGGEAADGMRMVLRLVHLITTLMERAPDGDCRPMPAPAIDG